MWSDDEIKGKILHKMVRMGKFRHSHTSFDNLQKGFPKELRGRVKELSDNLKKEGILSVKPTSYGEEVSVNLDKKEKIREYIGVFLDNE